MNINHHPTEDLLFDYATGALGSCHRLVIDSHLRACPTCGNAVAAVDRVGGALLSILPSAAMNDDALARALARIERPSPVAALAPAPRPDWISVPAAVSVAARKRRRWAAPGVWVAPVASGPGRSRVYLLRVGAGMSVPRHTHRGLEMVCVLKGAYRDGGAFHRVGDFACSDEAVDHRPEITADGECVCLVAAESPLVPRDWIGRIFQPFVGI